MKLSCSLAVLAVLSIDAVSGQCLICMDRPLDYPADLVDMSDFGMGNITCEEFEAISNADDTTPCSVYQLNRAECCDMPSAPPSPPANLAELCTAAATDMQSYYDCANACIDASCCEETCSTDFTCFEYLPCAVLEAINPPGMDDGPGGNFTGAVPPAPPGLADMCAADMIANDLVAYLECLNGCYPVSSSCCADTCSTDFACFEYAPCAVLGNVTTPTPSTDGPITAAPDNLAELCAADKVGSDFGVYLGCIEACLGGSCCEGACATDVAACIGYAPCGVLETVSEPPFGQGMTPPPLPPLPPAPTDLSDLCAAGSISTDLVAYLQCVNACFPASCCGDACSDDPNCLGYGACLVLDAVETPEPNEDGPAVAPPSNLAELCDATKVMTDFDSYVACLGGCLPGSCCGGACSTDFATCIGYAPCVILEAVDEPPFGLSSGGGGPVDPTTPPAVPGVTSAPAVPVTSAPVAAPTKAPVAAPTAAPDSGANGHSGLFRLVMSLLFTMAAVAIAE
mmetsp:Transcript_13564/g.32758  ORF Transcript_13564/g.32758 Transcript_13564/m.32758 type:complete len:512 (-) Transcript_13564:327-1862(-)